MSGWQVWTAIKHRLADRSEPVKTGQTERVGNASPSKGHAGDAKVLCCHTQSATRGTSLSDIADRRSDTRSRYERDLEALSKNWYPPDIYAFANYLRDGEREGPIELLFEHLWETYVHHCAESNRRAMTPRQLQNQWKKVGHTRRESTAVAPRRRWYVLPDDSADTSVDAHVVTISFKRGGSQ